MESRLKLMIRRMAPATVLLVLLLPRAAVAGAAGQLGSDLSAACGVTLLTDRDYFPVLTEEIAKARYRITLSAFFFKTTGGVGSLPDVILMHLLEAARRGVQVEVVVERGQEGDTVSRDNETTAGKLKMAGIRVCMDAPERTTHAKLVVIDGRILFVGSHNLTQSALRYNREASVRIDSERLAEEALRYLGSLCP